MAGIKELDQARRQRLADEYEALPETNGRKLPWAVQELAKRWGVSRDSLHDLVMNRRKAARKAARRVKQHG